MKSKTLGSLSKAALFLSGALLTNMFFPCAEEVRACGDITSVFSDGALNDSVEICTYDSLSDSQISAAGVASRSAYSEVVAGVASQSASEAYLITNTSASETDLITKTSASEADLVTKTSAAKANLITKKFDLGGKGTASGYTGVSATEKYNASKGYGFGDTNLTRNVSALGTGALSDAVHFQGSDAQFKVDIPTGVYQITVTTGNVEAVTIEAEGRDQLFFLTGNNATDSFTIPVTDGQLNIHAGAGLGSEYSLCTIEIEQISTGTTTKPTIWIVGDITAKSFYNVGEDSIRGWGEYLYKYVDTSKYDIRNLSIKDIRSEGVKKISFPTAEYYGKNGDTLLLPVGIDDYFDEQNAHPNAIDPSKYIANMTDVVRRAKKKGMKVYMVKQHGIKSDIYKYPLPTNMAFNNEAAKIARSEQVNIIDLYTPFQELMLDNERFDMKTYYIQYDYYLNALGADTLAKIAGEQLFPKGKKQPTPTPTGTPSVIFQTEPSGQAISNPHKGFVMSAHTPIMIESASFPYSINGSLNNRAWDVVTIVSGSPHWEDLNPAEGVYNWKEIDDMLDCCEKYGLTYGIRIMPYSSVHGSNDNYGAEHDFVPQWVYDKGAKKNRAPLAEDPSIQVDFPKWDDPVYLQAHKKFAKALAERYDNDPRVEFIDVRPFGDFGEWHNSFAVGEFMPSEAVQKDMLAYYAEIFKHALLAVPSSAYGEIYRYALSLGITKRHDGLICMPNIEWSLRPAYYANLPVVGENYWPYSRMKALQRTDDYSYVNWTPKHFRETIEISHLSIFALDQDSYCSYDFYREQKSVIDGMCNRLGYNYTVTAAARYGNTLRVTIKNTGLAPSYFNIDLCAEITDASGKKLADFGSPIRIASGTFRDDTEQTFEFVYSGTLASDATICLAMYDADNPLVQGKDPTVRFDNKNNLSNKRLKLVAKWTAPTPTPTKKATPTPTKKATPTPTKRGTPTPTKKATPTPTKHGTPTPTKKVTPTKRGTPTPTRRGTPTPTSNLTPTPSGRPSPLPTGNPSPSPTKRGTPTPTGRTTPTPTRRTSPTPTGIPPTPSVRTTPAPTGKTTPAPTGGTSPAPTGRATPAPTGRTSPAPTGSATPVPTGYATPTPTKRPTNTPTPTPGTGEEDPTFEDFVERLYTVAMNRESDPEGKAVWTQEVMENRRTGADCARYFLLEAPEFMNRKLSVEDFVETLYKTFFDRRSDAAGKKGWVETIKSGRKTRAEVVNDFIESTEWCNVCATYGVKSGAIWHKATIASGNATKFATRLYTRCLNREAAPEEVQYWALALTNREKSGSTAAKEFFTSEEFLKQKTSNVEFIYRLYETFFDRDPDAGELTYWSRKIKNGKETRQSILEFFGNSEEFKKLCKEYGID